MSDTFEGKSDAEIGAAVRSAAEELGKEKDLTAMIYGAGRVMIGVASKFGGSNLTFRMQGATFQGEGIGDWEVIIRESPNGPLINDALLTLASHFLSETAGQYSNNGCADVDLVRLIPDPWTRDQICRMCWNEMGVDPDGVPAEDMEKVGGSDLMRLLSAELAAMTSDGDGEEE